MKTVKIRVYRPITLPGQKLMEPPEVLRPGREGPAEYEIDAEHLDHWFIRSALEEGWIEIAGPVEEKNIFPGPPLETGEQYEPNSPEEPLVPVVEEEKPEKTEKAKKGK